MIQITYNNTSTLLLWWKDVGKPSILHNEADENEINKYPLDEIIQEIIIDQRL